MDQKLKNEILASAKTNRVHKIPIVESPFEPEERNVIWLNDGVMYYFNNGEWESLYSTSGGDTPEPEPLDPKYVRTPIEFTEFEIKEASMGGNPLSGAVSNMVSVQEEASEFQEGITITIKIPGQEDMTSSDTPIYVTAETTGEEAEIYVIIQRFLSEVYPNDTIEVVSVTYYQTERTALIIAKVNEENKTFTFMLGAVHVPEGGAITVNSPAEPIVNETDFLRMFPREIYPITGFTPTVFNKWEEGEGTYAIIGYYSNSSVDYDYFNYFEDGGYQYLPAINGTSSGQLWGLRDVNDEKKLLYSYNHSNDIEDTINPIIPIGQQYLYYNTNSGYVAITKDPNDLNKRMIFIEVEQYQIEETGLSYDDILKAYFDVDNIADIPSISIDLYRYNPYH